ncbi:hypothetical protein GSG79_004239 [Escherichia coli]|nr:hypothetical protein [Escherichia coli]
MNSLFHIVIFAVVTFAFGLSMWALGRHLRKQGHGQKLDRIERGYNLTILGAGKVLGPLGRGFLNAGSAMGRVPFFGSKTQRETFDNLRKLTKSPKGDESPPKS